MFLFIYKNYLSTLNSNPIFLAYLEQDLMKVEILATGLGHKSKGRLRATELKVSSLCPYFIISSRLYSRVNQSPKDSSGKMPILKLQIIP